MKLTAADSLKKHADKVQFGLFLVLLYLTAFEEPLAYYRRMPVYTAFNVIASAGLLVLLADLVLKIRKKAWSRRDSVLAAAVLVFLLCGAAGYLHFRYQTLKHTAISVFETFRFWLLLYLYSRIFAGFPYEKYKKHILAHVSLISLSLTGLAIADLFLIIWPRQVQRFRLGSIQIFYVHPAYFAAHLVFFLCMLFLLAGSFKAAWIPVPGVVLCLLLTLRFRIFGLVAAALLMAVFFLGFRQKLTWKSGLLLTAGALAIGGRRIWAYFFSPGAMTMARGQLAYNGLRTAVLNLPFGTGPGTFGSRAAQRWYSPLYELYGMSEIHGLERAFPSYACDTFWPMLAAEYGFLGLACYLTLVVFLFLKIRQLWERSAYIYLAAMTMFVYLLLETSGALAFSDEGAVSAALLLGVIFGMCRGNANQTPQVKEMTGAEEEAAA